MTLCLRTHDGYVRLPDTDRLIQPTDVRDTEPISEFLISLMNPVRLLWVVANGHQVKSRMGVHSQGDIFVLHNAQHQSFEVSFRHGCLP